MGCPDVTGVLVLRTPQPRLPLAQANTSQVWWKVYQWAPLPRGSRANPSLTVLVTTANFWVGGNRRQVSFPLIVHSVS